MKCKESIFKLMIWLVLLIHGAGFTSDDDDPKIVYVQKGGVAHFKVNTEKPVVYARIGSPEEHGINLEELYMRAVLKNNSLHINRINNTRYSQRLGFHGNNLSQGASFILRDITAEDNKAVFRVSYRERGKAPTKRDFEIVLKADTNETEAEKGIPPANTTTELPIAPETPDAKYPSANASATPKPSTLLTQQGTAVAYFVMAALLFVVLVIMKLCICHWLRKNSEKIERGAGNNFPGVDPQTMAWFVNRGISSDVN